MERIFLFIEAIANVADGGAHGGSIVHQIRCQAAPNGVEATGTGEAAIDRNGPHPFVFTVDEAEKVGNGVGARRESPCDKL